MRESRGRGGRAVPQRVAARRNGRPPPGARSRSVQPRRHESARKIGRQDYDVLKRVRMSRRRSASSSAPMPTATPPRLDTTSLEDSYRHCREIARQRAKNFYYSFLLLSKPQRDAMCAIYAFMRHCDDLSDDPTVEDAQQTTRNDCILARRYRTRAAGRHGWRSDLAGVSRHGTALQHPAPFLPRDDRRRHVGSRADE